MKKILYIASLACAFLFSGCEDFLTVESPDFSTDKFWRDKKDVEAGLSAVYGQLENRTGYYGFAEHKYPVELFRGDDMMYGSDITNSYPEMKDLYDYMNNNENAQAKEYWMNNYNGTNYANNVIYGIDHVQAEGEKMSQDDYNHLMGEAVFLRAYYHFKTILNWKEIIIRDAYLTSESQAHKEFSTREEGWNFICTELERAAKLLPVERPTTETGRVVKNVAYAYLGWAYLTRAYEESAKKDEFLTKALTALNSVKGAELESDFEALFNGSKPNNKEAIFELQFTNLTSDGAYHKHCLPFWVAAPQMGGWDEIRVSKKMHDEFLKEGKIAENGLYDARAYASMIFNDPYFETGEKVFSIPQGKACNYSEVFKPEDEIQYCFRKFLPETYELYKQEESYINIPLMRYANVMLMKAEALNEQGTENGRNEAISLINEIRRVHGKLPAMQGNTYEAVKAQIEHERMVEFSMECYRFYDLRRWGKLEEVMKADGRNQFTPDKAWLPVPLMEEQSNGAL